MKNPFSQLTRKVFITSIAAMSLFITGNANALLKISDIPIDVIEGVPANIILTMDDSGSMAWAFTPTGICGLSDEDRAKASEYNKQYYNPNILYTPAVNSNGTSLGDSSFTNAWENGYDQTGTKTDISTKYRVIWDPISYCSSKYPAFSKTIDKNNGSVTAYYYYFDTTKTNGGSPCVLSNSAHVNNSDTCYSRKTVSATSGTATGAVGVDETTNFANWYSYYRLRHLAAKTAGTRAFSGLSDKIRVSWNTLNNNNVPGDTLPFISTHRTNFFNWLTTVPASGGTPLRKAMVKVGEKYSTSSGKGSPYAKDPTKNISTTNPEYSCRQNFYFAFTDGGWNGSDPSPSAGNYDNNTHTIDYSPKYGTKNYTVQTSMSANKTPPIYPGSDTKYLADIALKYWTRDLRLDLDNDVPVYDPDKTTDLDGNGTVSQDDIFWNPKNDPAQWQHMVSFFIGMGVNGALNFDGTTTSGTTYTSLLKGSSGGGITWGNNTVDDMWHAAINGRGEYFSVSDPDTLVKSFQAVLNNIDNRSASSSAIATTSSELLNGAVLFQATYDPGKWTGDVRALDATFIQGNIITSTAASITTTLKWSASVQLNAQAQGGAGREIITYDPTTDKGVAFQWADLNAAQQAILNTGNPIAAPDVTLGQDRLAYLRGDQTKEQSNAGAFRNRTSLYGDIVNADPQFVTKPGPPVTLYPDSLESAAYSDFVKTNASRQDMLLTAANDGMLHILNADTGDEIMSYIPSSVFRNLNDLTSPSYAHKFFVDQTPRIEDVYLNSDASWHTIAFGALGKGGQGIYALDITKPSTLKETSAASTVLWEFTDTDDADLGYSYTRPQIFKMNNGKWMVGFNNGYNSNEDDTASGGQVSTTGNGIMYFIDLDTGGKSASDSLIKLDTGVGINEDPLKINRANRLTDFVAIDIDNNYTVDYFYAGDLFGNVWKFDVTSSNSNQWKVMGTAAKPKPLFTATDPSAKTQPVTQILRVIKHRSKSGYLIYFGTGKYLETGDRTDTQIQSVYAFWDRNETTPNINTIDRSHLLQQWMTFETTETDTDGSTFQARSSTLNATTKKFGRYVIDWFAGTGTTGAGTLSNTYLGWYIDLGVTGNLTSSTITLPNGEKIDKHLFIESTGQGVIEFNTLIPNDNPCDKGGITWTYRLDPYTGNRFATFTYLNGKNIPNQMGRGGGSRFSTTKTWNTPPPGTPNSPPGGCQEVNINNSSAGAISVSTNKCNNRGLGRRSWRQIHIK